MSRITAAREQMLPHPTLAQVRDRRDRDARYGGLLRRLDAIPDAPPLALTRALREGVPA